MLAINGGKKVREGFFPAQYYGDYQKNIDVSELKKITGSIMSGYRGNYSDAFMGGEWVRKAEAMFEGAFDHEIKALTVNSCTSALHVACAAIGLKPGDEVIVTPWSMTCSATAPMVFGAIPVFADIQENSFCLDPVDVRKKITKKTKAIIVVDLFGNPYDPELYEIAEEHGLYVIEDAAQAIGSSIDNEYSGARGHIGCFSFTQGKHLTCGEGGMIVTKYEELYDKCAAIRNHTEAVINSFCSDNYNLNIGKLENGVGFNFRMTELQAYVLCAMIPEIEKIIEKRTKNVRLLFNRLSDVESISEYEMPYKCKKSYYVMPIKYTGKDIEYFTRAVKAELDYEINRIDRGIPINNGYIKPIYRMLLFLNNQHWSIKDVNYQKVFCKNTMHYSFNEFMITLYHGLDLSSKDIDDIANAFIKVDREVNK